MTCTVTIAVPNAGSLTTAQAAVAQVNGVSSLNSAHFTYQREETVVAAASGTVSELCVKEGSTVRQDDVILRITGKDLDKQTKNALTACALPSCRCLLPRRPSATIPSTPDQRHHRG